MSGDYATSSTKRRHEHRENLSTDDRETENSHNEGNAAYHEARRIFGPLDEKRVRDRRDGIRRHAEIYCDIGEQVASLRTIFWLYLQRKVKRRIARRKQTILQKLEQTNNKGDPKGGGMMTSSAASRESVQSAAAPAHCLGNNSSDSNYDHGKASVTTTASFNRVSSITKSKKKTTTASWYDSSLVTAIIVILVGASAYLIQHGDLIFGKKNPPEPTFLSAPIPVIKDNAVKLVTGVMRAVENINDRISATDAWSRSTWEANKKKFKNKFTPPDKERPDPASLHSETTSSAAETPIKADEILEDFLKPTENIIPDRQRKPDVHRKRWPKNPFQKTEIDEDGGRKKRPATSAKRSGKEDFDDRANWLFAGSGITDLVDTLSTMPYAPTDLFRNPAVDWMKVLWRYMMSWVGCSLGYVFGYL